MKSLSKAGPSMLGIVLELSLGIGDDHNRTTCNVGHCFAWQIRVQRSNILYYTILL